MPCGYRDQRRQSYRCLHCRAHHSKVCCTEPVVACSPTAPFTYRCSRYQLGWANKLQCDRQRPCRPCKRRNLKCEDASAQGPHITLIEYSPPAPYQPLGRILRDESWLYVRIFLDAVSSTDMMVLSAFRFEEIGAFIQDQGPVFDAVATVGALYGSQTDPDLHLSPEKSLSLRKFCSTFRQHVKAKLQKPHALEDTSLLLCVQLLVMLEVSISSWHLISHR